MSLVNMMSSGLMYLDINKTLLFINIQIITEKKSWISFTSG